MCEVVQLVLLTKERPMLPGKANAFKQQGFTFVWAMAAVALISVGLSVVGPLWSDQSRREREHELLRIGAMYATAIANYYIATPGTNKHYPRQLEDLLADNRFWATRRHLRKLYPDPMDPGRPWGLVRASDGGIKGVYSLGEQQPFAQTPMAFGVSRLSAATRYADWHFVPDDAALKQRERP